MDKSEVSVLWCVKNRIRSSTVKGYRFVHVDCAQGRNVFLFSRSLVLWVGAYRIGKEIENRLFLLTDRKIVNEWMNGWQVGDGLITVDATMPKNEDMNRSFASVFSKAENLKIGKGWRHTVLCHRGGDMRIRTAVNKKRCGMYEESATIIVVCVCEARLRVWIGCGSTWYINNCWRTGGSMRTNGWQKYGDCIERGPKWIENSWQNMYVGWVSEGMRNEENKKYMLRNLDRN